MTVSVVKSAIGRISELKHFAVRLFRSRLCFDASLLKDIATLSPFSLLCSRLLVWPTVVIIRTFSAYPYSISHCSVQSCRFQPSASTVCINTFFSSHAKCLLPF